MQALSGLTPSWELKSSNIMQLSKKVSSKTGADGQKTIKLELESLHRTWTSFTEKLDETLSGLRSSKKGWDNLNALYKELTRWLQSVEFQLKEQELKADVGEKRSQVQYLKVAY